jgi:iron complex transport system permease protein
MSTEPKRTGRDLRPGLIIGAGLLALLLTTGLSTALGTVAVPLGAILRSIAQAVGLARPSGVDQTSQILIVLIRLPRVFAAIFAGAGLSVAGTAMQGLFRNPLAEPGILGVSAGASLGALVAIALGTASFLTLPAFAFGGALAAVLIILMLSALTNSSGQTTVLVLAGMAVSAFFSALTSLVLVLASEYQVSSYIFWTLGGLANRRWEHVLLLAVPVTVIGLLLFLRGRELDILLLGDETARSLGVSVRRTRIETVLLASLLTAVIVSVTGPIGFVGLIVPHIMRLIVGPSHRRLLLASGFGGAVFLQLCDLATRLIAMPRGIELSVGVMTALVGAPYFMFLLIRSLRTQT